MSWPNIFFFEFLMKNYSVRSKKTKQMSEGFKFFFYNDLFIQFIIVLKLIVIVQMIHNSVYLP